MEKRPLVLARYLLIIVLHISLLSQIFWTIKKKQKELHYQVISGRVNLSVTNSGQTRQQLLSSYCCRAIAVSAESPQSLLVRSRVLPVGDRDRLRPLKSDPGTGPETKTNLEYYNTTSVVVFNNGNDWALGARLLFGFIPQKWPKGVKHIITILLEAGKKCITRRWLS